jgi:hypothetical protein
LPALGDPAPEHTWTFIKRGVVDASTRGLVTSLAVPILAALGGAAVVFSAFDDSPGGSLIGLLLIVVATAVSVRARRRAG